MSDERTVERIRALGERLIDRAVHLEVKHGPFASAHEAHSVIREELEELFDEVRKKRELRSPLALRNEAMDIAAAALRFAAEVDPTPHAPAAAQPSASTTAETTDAETLRLLADWLKGRPQMLGLGVAAGREQNRTTSEMRNDLCRIADRLESGSDDARWADRVRLLEGRIHRAEQALRGPA